jgi:glycosyltransferase involved in cell wall biosynthesis
VELSIVIPAYNEAHRIQGTIEKISAFCEKEASRWELVVVDDGSSDGTSDVVSRTPRVRCLRNPLNAGKGFSVRRGMLSTKLEAVLFSDADLSTPIEEALALHQAIQRGADVAIATRDRSTGKQVRRTPHRRLMAMVFRTLVKIIVLRGFRDTQCGFKMFRRDAARSLFSRSRLDRWGFDVEILFLARNLGLRIAEVPVAWFESAETRLRFLTPVSMTWDLLKIRGHQIAGHYRHQRGLVEGEKE